VSDLLELADRIVGRARSGEQLEAFVTKSRRTNVTARKGAVESIESATTGGVGVRVVVDGRQGFAYAGSHDADAISAAIDEARDNATFATPDEFNGLAVPDGVAPPDLVLRDDRVAEIVPDRRVELALEVEEAALGVDPRVTGLRAAEWSDVVREAAVVSTAGIRVTESVSFWSAAADVLVADGDEVQESYGVRVGRSFDDIDPRGAGVEGAEKALALLGGKQPESRRVTVVLDPHVVGSFIGLIGATLVGDSVLKGRSPFADRMGEQVAAPTITLVDDPTEPESTGAGRMDGEGLASRRNALIDGGTLRGFLHWSWSARKAGTVSTASAVRDYASTPRAGAQALSLSLGTGDRDAILKQVDDGIWVQGVHGLHSGTNPVSGDFSVGMTGRVIRNGVLAEPVREATIASTLQRMLFDVVAVGGDRVWLPGGTGSAVLAIEGVSLSGR
jgi:PmbA protein